MEPYPSGQFEFIDDPDRQFGNCSVWTRTRTRIDGPDPLLTLPMPTPEEAMHDLLEEATTTGLTNEHGDASTWAALHSSRGGYRSQGSVHGEHGGSGGSKDNHESMCTYCKIDSHSPDACRKWKHAQEGGSSGGNDEHICYQCWLPGHVKVDCVSSKRIKQCGQGRKPLLQQLSLRLETAIPSDQLLLLSPPLPLPTPL